MRAGSLIFGSCNHLLQSQIFLGGTIGFNNHLIYIQTKRLSPTYNASLLRLDFETSVKTYHPEYTHSSGSPSILPVEFLRKALVNTPMIDERRLPDDAVDHKLLRLWS